MALTNNLLPDEVIARGVGVPHFGDIPSYYWAGQDRAIQNQQRELFSGGLPRNPDGTVNWDQVADALARVQGAGAIGALGGLRTADIQQEALRGSGGAFFPPGSVPPVPQSQVQPAPRPQPAPVSIQRGSGTTQAPTQQTASVEPSSGVWRPPGQNLGEVTGVSIDGQPTVEPLAFSDRFAGQNPLQTAQLQQRPVTTTREGGVTVDSNLPAPPGQQTAQARPPRPPDPVEAGGADYFTEENAKRFEDRATWRNYWAQRYALGGLREDAIKAQAAQDADRAKQIREHLGKNRELTPGEKQARSGGSPNTQEQERAETFAKEDAKAFVEQQKAIQASANNAAAAEQKARLAKNLTLDPRFTSGPWGKGAEQFQQWRRLFGGDPSSAVPIEAFNKLGSDMLQDSIKSMGQSGVGRVLQAEVGIMQKAIASQGITDASNRAILEMNIRVQQKMQEIARITAHLPPKTAVMNETIQNYLKSKPLFTPEEVANPVLLGAPDQPPGSTKWTPQQWQAWGARGGLRSGDPVRIQGGGYMAIP